MMRTAKPSSRTGGASSSLPRTKSGKGAPTRSPTRHATSSSRSGAAAGAGGGGAGRSSSRAASTPTAVSRSKSGRSLKPARIRFSLSDMELKTTLGTGTFGRVRLAYHAPTRKHYALKILKKSEIIRLKQVDHIKSEVVILTMISHPFIVNMLGHHQDDRRLYMLLEYVPGGELFSHLRQQRKFSNDISKFYAAEIISAFQHLHSYNIVYRDLKPENLLITRTGHIKITDFGFAKIVADKTWTLCGTPEYLAPEIIQSKGHGKSVDWWAIGVLIYEMLAGFPPFFDDAPFAIYQKILAGRIEFPRHFDVRAKDLIRKLLAADTSKRLGCLRSGAEDVKAHKWFSRLDWDAVVRCRIEAPFIPEVKGEDDTSNFDDYPESTEDTAKPLTPADRARFAEFDHF